MYYLLIVCSEWEERQTSGICHITKLEVAEAVTQCYRLLDLRTGYGDALIPSVVAFLPNMFGCRLVEDLVLTCYLEAFYSLEAIIGTKFVVEMYLHGVAYYLHLLECHALADEVLHAVCLIESLISETFAHLALLAWMNLLYLVWIN